MKQTPRDPQEKSIEVRKGCTAWKQQKRKSSMSQWWVLKSSPPYTVPWSDPCPSCRIMQCCTQQQPILSWLLQLSGHVGSWIQWVEGSEQEKATRWNVCVGWEEAAGSSSALFPECIGKTQNMSHSRWHNMPILNFTQIPENIIHTRASERRLRFRLCATQLSANPVSWSWPLPSGAGQHRVSVLLLKKPRHRVLQAT